MTEAAGQLQALLWSLLCDSAGTHTVTVIIAIIQEDKKSSPTKEQTSLAGY